MTKVIGWTVLLAGAAWAGWWYWQESKQENAAAWAAGTDPVH